MKKSIYAAAVLMVLIIGGVSAADILGGDAVSPQFVGSGNFYFYEGANAIIGIATGGNVVYFEGPLGYQHLSIGLGFPNDGYTLCYGPTTGNENIAYDFYQLSSNVSMFFTSFSECLAGTPFVKGLPFPAVFFSPDGNGCSNYAFSPSPLNPAVISASRPLDLFYYTQTVDGVLRIKTSFHWDGSQSSIDVTQTVKNMSGSSVKVTLKRDNQQVPDISGSIDGGTAALNWHGKTSDTVFSWNDPADMPPGHAAHKMELRGLSIPDLTHTTLVGGIWIQCPTVEPNHSTLQGNAGGTLEWNLGTLTAGQEQSRHFRYSAH